MDLNGKECRATKAVEVLNAISEYRKFIEDSGRKWKIEEGLQALQIDAGWLTDGFTFSVIQFFLFHRHAPQEAFKEPYARQPAWWVDVSTVLDGLFGVSL